MIKQEKLQTNDLEAINRLTFRELSESEVFSFSATFITDQPTANGRIWSTEWMEKNAKGFVGVPVLLNHVNDQENKVATVFESAFVAEEKAIKGKAFIPLLTDKDRANKEEILAIKLSSVSIQAIAPNTKQEGDLTRVLPSDQDRPLEVSFVAVGGCSTCKVTATEAMDNALKESCEEISPMPDSLREFAQEKQAELVTDYVRYSAFVLGTEIDRQTYKRYAESIDPKALSKMTKDLRTAYDNMNKQESSTESKTEDVSEMIDNLKKQRGY